MITKNLRINQLSRAGYDWYLAYLGAMDRRDVAAYVAFVADGCELRFNNSPPIVGKNAIRDMLSNYWRSFAEIEHDLHNIYGTDRAFMLEAANHYLRHDGRRVSLAAVALTDRDDHGLVTSVRLYTDTAPLFAE